jgi:hypothetical protein
MSSCSMWVKERTMLDAEKRRDSQEAATSPSYRFPTIIKQYYRHSQQPFRFCPTDPAGASTPLHNVLQVNNRRRDLRACLLLVHPFDRAGITGTHGDGIPRSLYEMGPQRDGSWPFSRARLFSKLRLKQFLGLSSRVWPLQMGSGSCRHVALVSCPGRKVYRQASV